MEIVVRVTIIFFFIWAVTRALGKRELAEMTAFELVLLITLGDLVQQGATQNDTSVTGTLLALSTIALWVLILSYAGFRWRKARKIVQGEAVIVLEQGHLLESVLRTERITSDEVLESARNQGIEDLTRVRWGILEADGKFAFILEPSSQGHQSQAVVAEERVSQ